MTVQSKELKGWRRGINNTGGLSWDVVETRAGRLCRGGLTRTRELGQGYDFWFLLPGTPKVMQKQGLSASSLWTGVCKTAPLSDLAEKLWNGYLCFFVPLAPYTRGDSDCSLRPLHPIETQGDATSHRHISHCRGHVDDFLQVDQKRSHQSSRPSVRGLLPLISTPSGQPSWLREFPLAPQPVLI